MQFWKAHMLILCCDYFCSMLTLQSSSVTLLFSVTLHCKCTLECNTAKALVDLLHSFTGQKCSFMLETQQRGCKSLQRDGSVLVLVTLEHSTTTRVLRHLAVFGENSLTDAQNRARGFCMKTRLMQKSQWVVIYKFPLQLLLYKI